MNNVFASKFTLPLFLSMISTSAYAEDPLGNAINYTREVVELGRQGQIENLARRAQKALWYVIETEKSDPSANLKSAQHCLEEVIEHSENNHPEQAAKHASEALYYLKLLPRWKY